MAASDCCCGPRSRVLGGGGIAAGSGRRGRRRGTRRARFRRRRHRRAGGARRGPLHRPEARVQVADQLVEPVLEGALPVLQLLDPAGQAAELLLELAEADLELPEATGIGHLRGRDPPQGGDLVLDPRQLAGQTGQVGLRRQRAPRQHAERAANRKAEAPTGPAAGPRHPFPDQLIVLTTVTARRFSAHAPSSWPGLAGRSSP